MTTPPTNNTTPSYILFMDMYPSSFARKNGAPGVCYHEIAVTVPRRQVA